MTYLGPKCFVMVPPSPVATTLQSLQDFHLRRQPAPRPGPRQCRRRTWSPLGCCQKRMRPSLAEKRAGVFRLNAFGHLKQEDKIQILVDMLFSLVYVQFSRENHQHENTKEASLQIPFQESFFMSVLLRLQYCALCSLVTPCWLSNYLSDGTFMSHVFNHQSCGLKTSQNLRHICLSHQFQQCLSIGTSGICDESNCHLTCIDCIWSRTAQDFSTSKHVSSQKRKAHREVWEMQCQAQS